MNIATIIDVIDAYPKPCRLAFYLTFEIVNINLANVRSDHFGVAKSYSILRK